MVQASWTVGDEQRSYIPLLVETEVEAISTAAEMQDTLAHFPTLSITLRIATAEEVALAHAAMPQRHEQIEELAMTETHLVRELTDSTTLCGNPTAGQRKRVTVEAVELGIVSGNACKACLKAAGTTHRGDPTAECFGMVRRSDARLPHLRSPRRTSAPSEGRS